MRIRVCLRYEGVTLGAARAMFRLFFPWKGHLIPLSTDGVLKAAEFNFRMGNDSPQLLS